VLITSIIFLLLSNAVTLRRDKSALFSRVAILVLLYCSHIALNSLYLISLDRGIGLFGGLFHATSTTQIFQIFIFIISSAILQLTSFYPRRVWMAEFSSLNKLFRYKLLYYKTKILDKMGQQYKIIEYPLILLFIITGAVFLISSSDLVSIFLSIELQSYGLYLLSTLYRNSELATSGGLTYFLLGGLSSCFILLGTTLLYANSGTTSLEGLYVVTSISDLSYTSLVNDVETVTDILDLNNEALDWYKADYINISFLILSVGFLFKVSAAPFHFWSPDVYDAIPTIVTTFVAIIAKISIFIFFLELVHYTGNSLFNSEYSWTTSLIVSSLLSLIIGTVLGLSQVRIKRLFAYSTISHLGFILLVLTLTITIFSFVGIPPLIGFFGKQMVLSAALDSGFVFMALVAILTSVISAVYYLNIIKQIFFDQPDYEIKPEVQNLSLQANIVRFNSFTANSEKLTFNLDSIVLSSSLTVTISYLSIIIVIFMFIPEEWLSMANILALIVFNT